VLAQLLRLLGWYCHRLNHPVLGIEPQLLSSKVFEMHGGALVTLLDLLLMIRAHKLHLEEVLGGLLYTLPCQNFHGIALDYLLPVRGQLWDIRRELVRRRASFILLLFGHRRLLALLD
jgi:hypothetical protein